MFYILSLIRLAVGHERENIMKYIGKKLFVQMIIGFFIGRIGICGMCVLGISYFAAIFADMDAKLLIALCVIAGMFSNLLLRCPCVEVW